MHRYYMGIDLGGTLIKLGLIDVASDPPQLGQVIRVATPASAEEIIEAMVTAAQEMIARCGAAGGEVAGVGIGAPGPLDFAQGVIVNAPNLPGVSGLPIRDRDRKSVV
jgi:glucokinase